MSRQEFDLKIIEKRIEAKDAVTLKLEIPNELTNQFKAKAGQFIGVTAQINGEEVHRSYSLSSGPQEEALEISIKKIPQGKMSTYLVDTVREGETLKVVPPVGHFYKDYESKRHHVMFAAGSGVTPMLSILKFLKDKKSDEQASLFYWNQTQESSMFLKELLERARDIKFNLFLGFTKEKPELEEACFFKRCDQEDLKDCFYKWSVSIDMPVFYLCGPEDFMTSIEFFLGTKGYDPSQIRKESFNTSAAAEADVVPLHDKKEDGPLYIGDVSTLSNESGGGCEAKLDGDTISVEPTADETILEAFLRDGESPPYSCMEGTCIACQCKVVEGLVEMPKDSFISDEDIADGLVLSCQAKIKSKKVKVDFDDY
jgi:ring-1,2-phenylacetyl-CoA epoxidase subunit PaaE